MVTPREFVNVLQLDSASIDSRCQTVELEFSNSVDIAVHRALLRSVLALVVCERPESFIHDLAAESRTSTGTTLTFFNLLIAVCSAQSLPMPQSALIACLAPSVCLSVCLFICPLHNSKTNDPKVFKLCIGKDLGMS